MGPPSGEPLASRGGFEGRRWCERSVFLRLKPLAQRPSGDPTRGGRGGSQRLGGRRAGLVTSVFQTRATHGPAPAHRRRTRAAGPPSTLAPRRGRRRPLRRAGSSAAWRRQGRRRAGADRARGAAGRTRTARVGRQRMGVPGLRRFQRSGALRERTGGRAGPGRPRRGSGSEPRPTGGSGRGQTWGRSHPWDVSRPPRSRPQR